MTLRSTLATILTATRRGIPTAPSQPGALAAAMARHGSGAVTALHAGDGEDDYAYGTGECVARQHERGRIKAILNSRAGLAEPRRCRAAR